MSDQRIDDLEESLRAMSLEIKVMRTELLGAVEDVRASVDYIVPPGGHDPQGFSGNVWIAGTKFTGKNDTLKPFVAINAATATESDGPVVTGDPNIEWYEKANTVGDIHVTRF